MRVLMAVTILLLAGCLSVGRTVLVGGLDPVPESAVRFYFPADSVPEHVRVAVLEVGSNDMMNKTTQVLDKLRAEAAKLGANGVILIGTETQSAQSQALAAYYSGTYLGARQKTLAVAIRTR